MACCYTKKKVWARHETKTTTRQMHEYVALTQTKSGCACQEKAWHAHEPYVNACGCNMKNWTRNGIAS